MLRFYKDQFSSKITLYFTPKAKYNKIAAEHHKPKQQKVGNPMLNKFLVAGRMTADPEIKTAGGGRKRTDHKRGGCRRRQAEQDGA